MTSTVPYGADQTVYVVVEGDGRQAAGQNEIETTDVETVVTDLMSGRFHDPIGIVAFNTLEHWSSDISAEIAREIQSRCDSDGLDIPQYLAGFMETHLNPRNAPQPTRHLTHRRGLTKRRLTPSSPHSRTG
jgi:hypothetical protein